MNGLKCYFTRDQILNLVQVGEEKKLDPKSFLGECSCDVSLCDDGRVEVTFWKREDVATCENKDIQPTNKIEAELNRSVEEETDREDIVPVTQQFPRAVNEFSAGNVG